MKRGQKEGNVSKHNTSQECSTMPSGSKFSVIIKILLTILFVLFFLQSCIKLSKKELGTRSYVENLDLDFPAVTVCPQLGSLNHLIMFDSNFTLEDLYSIPNPRDIITATYESFHPFFSR